MDRRSVHYIKNNKTDVLDVLLHGASGGMIHSNMQKIFKACVGQGHSVVNFNFPFFERGDEQSSGPELKEEIETLKKILSFCHANEYKNIRLIGKSLGAIIAARYLSTLPLENQKKFSVVIFGYDTGMIDISDFPGKISIIQGQKDKFGDIQTVKNDLKNAASKNISYFEIPNADHSFRNEDKEPVYEDEAIEVFLKI